MLEIAHAGAAIFLFDGDPEHAEIAELAPQLRRKLVRAVDIRSAGRNLGRGEIRHALAQHVRCIAEIEVQ